jgi:hypothetical protein
MPGQVSAVPRVPAVYLDPAFVAILAFLAS